MSWVYKFDFAVDEEKRVLNPSRDKKKEKASTTEGRRKIKTTKKMTFWLLALLLCDLGWHAPNVKICARNRRGDDTHTLLGDGGVEKRTFTEHE